MGSESLELAEEVDVEDELLGESPSSSVVDLDVDDDPELEVITEVAVTPDCLSLFLAPRLPVSRGSIPRALLISAHAAVEQW